MHPTKLLSTTSNICLMLALSGLLAGCKTFMTNPFNSPSQSQQIEINSEIYCKQTLHLTPGSDSYVTCILQRNQYELDLQQYNFNARQAINNNNYQNSVLQKMDQNRPPPPPMQVIHAPTVTPMQYWH
jgi:hypothetical protein